MLPSVEVGHPAVRQLGQVSRPKSQPHQALKNQPLRLADEYVRNYSSIGKQASRGTLELTTQMRRTPWQPGFSHITTFAAHSC